MIKYFLLVMGDTLQKPCLRVRMCTVCPSVCVLFDNQIGARFVLGMQFP